MAHKYVNRIDVVNGLVQGIYGSELTVDDLPRQDPLQLQPGTKFGSFTVDQTGRITTATTLADGTYYSLTVASGLVTGSTTAPSASARLATHSSTVGTSGSSETDLYSDTIAAGQLATNGDSLRVSYGGNIVGDAVLTRRLRLYFGGTAVLDTTTLAVTTSTGWHLSGQFVRVSSSVVRFSGVLTTSYAAGLGKPDANNTAVAVEVTGLTLSGTNILKITGQCQAGSADSDVAAWQGLVIYDPV